MPTIKETRGTAMTKPTGTKAARAAVVKGSASGGRSTEVVDQDGDQAMCLRIGGVWTPPMGTRAGYCTVPKQGAMPSLRAHVFRGDPCHRHVWGNEKYILVPYTAKLMADLKKNYKTIK